MRKSSLSLIKYLFEHMGLNIHLCNRSSLKAMVCGACCEHVHINKQKAPYVIEFALYQERQIETNGINKHVPSSIGKKGGEKGFWE